MTSASKRTIAVLFHVVLLVYAIIVLFPIVQMLLSSVKTTPELFQNPYGLPKAMQWVNYAKAWNQAKFGVYLKNSVYVSSVSVFLELLFASMAAYVLARFKFWGNHVLYLFFLLGLMLPMRLAIIPLFLLIRDIGLMNTHTGLILVYVASGLPFSIFLLVNFFRTIPTELEEAAYIEGANYLQVYARIMVPLVRPALATVGIFNFLGFWNDFFFPLILLRSKSLMTFPVGMTTFFGEYSTQWNLLFAALALSIVPVIIVFLLLSRQFIQGLTSGAIK